MHHTTLFTVKTVCKLICTHALHELGKVLLEIILYSILQDTLAWANMGQKINILQCHYILPLK